VIAGPVRKRQLEGAPISIDLLPRLATLVAATKSPLSEYCLANLFLFRGRHDYRFHEGPIPHVRGVTYDGLVHAMPLAPIDEDVARCLLDHANCIAPLGDEALEYASRFGLACDWQEADSDYIYSAERLARLAGAKAKRAQARAFARDSRPEARILSAETLSSAQAVLEGWFEDVGRNASATDLAECREGLAHRVRLGLDGLVVIANGEPAAFLLAGDAADGSRIVHFAKGRRAYSGAYPWMFAAYAARAGADRINFEQDLGNAGFAQAKRAFAPAGKLRKFRLKRG
jgi:hypothetical protein